MYDANRANPSLHPTPKPIRSVQSDQSNQISPIRSARSDQPDQISPIRSAQSDQSNQISPIRSAQSDQPSQPLGSISPFCLVHSSTLQPYVAANEVANACASAYSRGQHFLSPSFSSPTQLLNHCIKQPLQTEELPEIFGPDVYWNQRIWFNECSGLAYNGRCFPMSFFSLRGVEVLKSGASQKITNTGKKTR